jgi:hypothetical protein
LKQWFIVRTAAEAADRSEGEALVAAARSKGLVGLTAGEHGAYGQAEDGGKGVVDAAAVSRVGEVRQDLEEGGGRRHAKASGLGLGLSLVPAT